MIIPSFLYSTFNQTYCLDDFNELSPIYKEIFLLTSLIVSVLWIVVSYINLWLSYCLSNKNDRSFNLSFSPKIKYNSSISLLSNSSKLVIKPFSILFNISNPISKTFALKLPKK